MAMTDGGSGGGKTPTSLILLVLALLAAGLAYASYHNRTVPILPPGQTAPSPTATR